MAIAKFSLPLQANLRPPESLHWESTSQACLPVSAEPNRLLAVLAFLACFHSHTKGVPEHARITNSTRLASDACVSPKVTSL